MVNELRQSARSARQAERAGTTVVNVGYKPSMREWLPDAVILNQHSFVFYLTAYPQTETWTS